RDGLRHLLAALCEWRIRLHRAELGEREGHACHAVRRLVATHDVELAVVAEAVREGVGLIELPGVNETVMARGALEIRAEEDLGDVLCRLHDGALARIHHAAPDNALEIT